MVAQAAIEMQEAHIPLPCHRFQRDLLVALSASQPHASSGDDTVGMKPRRRARSTSYQLGRSCTKSVSGLAAGSAFNAIVRLRLEYSAVRAQAC